MSARAAMRALRLVGAAQPAPPGSSTAGEHGPEDELAPLRADPRRAVGQDGIRCLVCGRQFRQLTNTHLRFHGVTATEYKRRFGYNRNRPLMCLALRQLYAERAIRTGLASRIRQRPIVTMPELRRRGGTRPMSLEERLTRREVRARARRAGAGPPASRAALLGLIAQQGR